MVGGGKHNEIYTDRKLLGSMLVIYYDATVENRALTILLPKVNLLMSVLECTKTMPALVL